MCTSGALHVVTRRCVRAAAGACADGEATPLANGSFAKKLYVMFPFFVNESIIELRLVENESLSTVYIAKGVGRANETLKLRFSNFRLAHPLQYTIALISLVAS